MKQHGLSAAQIHALMYISHSGECQVSDIGALAGASEAAASQLVERLVQQGLVERRENPANRRTKTLKLSGKGEELIRESFSANHLLMDVLSALDSDQQKTVQAAFDVLTRAARRIQTSEKGKEGKHA